MLKKNLVKEASVLLFTSILIFSTINATANTIQKNTTTKNTNISKTLSSTTWYVDDDAAPDGDGSREHPFKTIREALKHAESGDTIYVFEGVYEEILYINKSNINLIGEDKNETTIDGRKDTVVISINADYVKITDFTIKKGRLFGVFISRNYCNISNNIVSHNGRGIVLYKAYYTTITNNVVIKNRDIGIELGWSFDNTPSPCLYNIIENNIISESWLGIVLSNSCSYNTITRNNISLNDIGINIDYSHENNILHNHISNNGEGISLLSSDDTTIKDNVISYNNVGIRIILCRYDIDALKRDNTFIDNGDDIKQPRNHNKQLLFLDQILQAKPLIKLLNLYTKLRFR